MIVGTNAVWQEENDFIFARGETHQLILNPYAGKISKFSILNDFIALQNVRASLSSNGLLTLLKRLLDAKRKITSHYESLSACTHCACRILHCQGRYALTQEFRATVIWSGVTSWPSGPQTARSSMRAGSKKRRNQACQRAAASRSTL